MLKWKINNKLQFLNFLADIIISIPVQNIVNGVDGVLICNTSSGFVALPFFDLHKVHQGVSYNLCSCPFASFPFNSHFGLKLKFQKDKIRYHNNVMMSIKII